MHKTVRVNQISHLLLIHCTPTSLFKLFLGAELTGMSTFLLAAIGSPRRQASVALAADGLVAIEGLRQHGQGGIVDSTAQTQYQMQSTFLLNVVIGQGSSIFQLLPRKDQALLVGRDAFLVLNFGLDVVDSIGWFHIQGDRLARQGLDEDLHGGTRLPGL
jgi:hypothetical protein